MKYDDSKKYDKCNELNLYFYYVRNTNEIV